MTSKDSSGDKLVASIRKTRAGMVSPDTKTTKKTVAKTQKKVVAKKAVRKKKAVSKSTSKQIASNKEQLVDMFQSGRRVWPD